MRIEEPQVLDFVIEEIDAHRAFRPGREDVDERAPDGEVPGVKHLFDTQVTLTDEPFPQRPGVKPVTSLQHQRPAGDEVRRRQPVQQRLGVDDERLPAAGNKVVEHRQPFGKQFRRRRERVIREASHSRRNAADALPGKRTRARVRRYRPPTRIR